MTTTLTQEVPAFEIPASIGSIKNIATSGVIGASPATLKLQYRVNEADEWVDTPGVTFEENTHLSGNLSITALYNRVVVVDPDGTTLVNLNY